MPACALTISASAQKLTPSPYGSERPCRHQISSGSASATCDSSYTSRDLPIPGTPTSVTSCGDRSARTRASASRSTPSSRSRPTSAALAWCGTSTPSRARAATASHTGTGSRLPFAATGTAGRYSITARVCRNVRSPTSTPFTGAAACNRAAVFTTSPAAIPSPCPGRAPSVTSASPVFTPTRTWTWPSSRAQSRIASAARTARSGSSSCAAGAPNSAITASPMNFSTVPPNRSSSARSRA
jgi:hypothetical protein